MRGEHGFQQVEVNALSRAIRQLGSVPPVPGHDLVLTVDTRFAARQRRKFWRSDIAELAADEERIPAARRCARSSCWTCSPGAVLAMASVPTYDTNMFFTDDRVHVLASNCKRDSGLPHV